MHYGMLRRDGGKRGYVMRSQLLSLSELTAGKFLTVNNTFCFATTDKVFYYVASVLTTCFGPYIRPSSCEFIKY
jgi:hypothetical protein